MDSVEYQESKTITLHWTLRGLKQLFDSSKGESKSKVTKSVRFGGGQWQILFYANSGTEGGAYVSVYLSCEPTIQEKEKAINGKWVREGLYKFSFELRNLAKTVLFNQKEACDHSFSYKTANWGWAQFARRDAVFYQPNTVRHQDAFLISCIITSSPSPPAIPSLIPQQSVPKDLLDAVGALLDDPNYADVEFVLPHRGSSNGTKAPRKIYAAKRLLLRADYFEAMFNSGFAEASSDRLTLTVGSQINESSDTGTLDGRSDVVSLVRQFEDSDTEDEETTTDIENGDGDGDGDSNDTNRQPFSLPTEFDSRSAMSVTPNKYPPSLLGSSSISSGTDGFESLTADDAHYINAEEDRNVRAKLSHPSSPRQRDVELEKTPEPTDTVSEQKMTHGPHGPQKVKVVVKDVAYATYRAVLYYLYTDTILFAPLSSSFFFSSSQTSGPSTSSGASQLQPPSDSSGAINRSGTQAELNTAIPATRSAWIKEWEQNNPGRIAPCSAKAVYRLADKLDLSELKNRAFQHIIKSLTIHNVPYEIFSTFSAMFEEVRKVQISYFLDNWNNIRNSDAMWDVWSQIRIGRHPGFEEVWPLIAANLEFHPRIADAAGGDSREGPGLEF